MTVGEIRQAKKEAELRIVEILNNLEEKVGIKVSNLEKQDIYEEGFGVEGGFHTTRKVTITLKL